MSLRGAFHVDPYGNLLREHTLQRLRKALSPQWLASKLAATAYEIRHPDAPWITARAVALIERRLRPQHRVFEFGAGASTTWFARRAAFVATVEHNPVWFRRVRDALDREGRTNADLRFVPERDYLAVIDAFPEASFDFVLADGIFRDESIAHALPRLAPGGWLVVDNINWLMRSGSATPHSLPLQAQAFSPLMERLEPRLREMLVEWTTNGINDTAIFARAGVSAAS